MNTEFDLFNPTEEHAMLRRTLRDFVAQEVEPQALEHDRTEKFNVELFRKLGDLGLHGVTVSADDGGAGMDGTAAVIATEELSTSDPGFCLAYLAHAILFVHNFWTNASSEQKARYLDKVISGEWIAGMCMTEPDFGTDVLGMRTTAEAKGDHYLLNGQKMWITNGAISETEPGDLFLVYAKTNGRISSFLVEKGFEGFSLGQKIHDKLGMRASPTAELVFDDCRVPKENLIGEEGASMLHMMRNLEIERLTLAAMSLGMARRALDVMIAYAGERKAFGKPIAEFGQIQKHIGDSYAKYMAGRCYVYDVARRMNPDRHGQRIDSDGVKLYCSTMAKEVCDSAMQVLGGYGYVGEYVVERLWRDAKLIEIGGGTLEAHQKNMARDLGRHPEVLR